VNGEAGRGVDTETPGSLSPFRLLSPRPSCLAHRRTIWCNIPWPTVSPTPAAP